MPESSESDQGVCCAGSSCEPSDRQTCSQIGGTFTAKGQAGCSVTQIILDYLKEEHGQDIVVFLLAGGTNSLLYDARDRILSRSEFGQKVLAIYRIHSPEILALSRKNRELRRQILVSFLKLAAFSRIMLRFVRAQEGDPILKSKAKYTDGLHMEMVAVAHRIATSGPSTALMDALQSLLTDAESFIGMSLASIFAKLGVVRDRPA